MLEGLRLRFWFEAAGAGASSLALALSLLWPDWIERVVGVEPDGGDGSYEWLIVVLLAVITVGSSVLARFEWYRTRRLPAV